MILVVGEALVDVVEHPDGTRREHPGGSPANVAVGLGRAGLDVTLATTLADDRYGELIRQHLIESRVTLQAAVAPRTSSAVAKLGESGSATYEFDLTWDPSAIDSPILPAAIHTGSIATVLEPGSDEVHVMVQQLRSRCIITFDPNVRPSITPDRDDVAERVGQLVRLADVVKVSDEDVAWLYPGTSIDEATERWLDDGPSLVVVTRGGDGSVARTRSGRVEVAPPPVDVVDTVGAGDAYMSGLLIALDAEGLLDVSARQRLRELDDAMVRRLTELAGRSAAIVVGRAGAEPPWRHELMG